MKNCSHANKEELRKSSVNKMKIIVFFCPLNVCWFNQERKILLLGTNDEFGHCMKVT